MKCQSQRSFAALAIHSAAGSASRSRLLLTGLLLHLLSCGCDSQPTPAATTAETAARPKFEFRPKQSPRPDESATTVAATEITFPGLKDVAQSLGVHHVYNNGASPRALMVESTGGGCGWFD
ncbi:MAG: hypothetical protein ACKPJJ_14425, partial [Planctomycetaceae bacterium]